MVPLLQCWKQQGECNDIIEFLCIVWLFSFYHGSKCAILFWISAVWLWRIKNFKQTIWPYYIVIHHVKYRCQMLRLGNHMLGCSDLDIRYSILNLFITQPMIYRSFIMGVDWWLLYVEAVIRLTETKVVVFFCFFLDNIYSCFCSAHGVCRMMGWNQS